MTRGTIRSWLLVALGAALLAAGCEEIQVAGGGDTGGGDTGATDTNGGGDTGGGDATVDGGGPDATRDAGGPDGGCPGGVCPCADDEACRTRGEGFWCEDGVCTTGADGGRFLLIVSVTGGSTVEDPAAPISATVDETAARVDLDASASLYIGPGSPAFAWSVVGTPDVAITLSDAGTAHAWFDLPPIWDDEVVELALTATDGSGEAAGTAAATVILTLRDTQNDAPVVDVVANPEEARGGQQVVLDAAGSWDPNGDGLALPFQWEQTEGPSVTLTDASTDGDGSVVSFVAPVVTADIGLAFVVTVSDDGSPPAEGEATVRVVALAGGCTGHAACDDGNPCTRDTCGGDGVCANDPVGNGAPCSDDDVCTTGDACQGGVCRPGTPRTCPDDDDPCTAPLCAHPDGCGFAPLTDVPCDDGDPCTADDTCTDAGCVGVPDPGLCGCSSDEDCEDDGDLCNGTPFCDDAMTPPTCRRRPGSVVSCPPTTSECRTNTCDPASGECVPGLATDGFPCDDGLVCTVGDKCLDGECKADAAPDCEDTDPCTEDYCSEEADGCVHERIDGCCVADEDCEDWNPCTEDVCEATGCQNVAIPDCCVTDADCLDGGRCDAGTCVWDPPECTSAAQCDDERPCTVDSCDTGTGQCVHETLEAGAPCDPFGVIEPPTSGFHGAVCDGRAACRMIERDLYPDNLPEVPTAMGVEALWQAGASGSVFAAGWVGGYAGSEFDEREGVILAVSGARFDRLSHHDQRGAYRAVHGGLAVGDGSVALRTSSGWTDVEFGGLQSPDLGSVYGAVVPGTEEGAWNVVDRGGSLFLCAGDLANRIGLSWECVYQGIESQPLGPGPVTGLMENFPDLSRLRAQRWYFVNDGNGANSVWHHAAEGISPDAEWTVEFPGCDARSGEPGCAEAKAWRDAHALGTVDAPDVWAVGDEGVIAHIRPNARSWRVVEVPRELLLGRQPWEFTWTGVWSAGPYAFVAGRVDGCFEHDGCGDEITARSLVLLVIHAADERPTGLVVLDRQDCTWSEFVPDVRMCASYPIENARVTDVWGSVRETEAQVWIGGSWPVYEENLRVDRRAALYGLTFDFGATTTPF